MSNLDERYPSWLKLVKLQVIHRHGPRTPLNYRLHQFYPFSWSLCSAKSHRPFYPDGINIIISGDESFLKEITPNANGNVNSACLLGQLTDRGRMVMKNLGESLKSLYFDSLNFQVTPSEIFLRSTNFPRTIESLQAVLTGLFPNARFAPQVLPVHVRDEYIEDMYGSTRCTRYRILLEQYAERFAKETAKEREELCHSLPHIFKVPDVYGKLPSVYGVYDTLFSSVAHDLPLPSGVDNKVLAQLDRLAALEWFHVFKESKDAVKFSVGRFLREIDTNLYRDDRRLCIYSAHDSTIAPIIAALSDPENSNPSNPPFGAHITIELFENKTFNQSSSNPNLHDQTKLNEQEGQQVVQHYVRVLYNNDPLLIPHCALPGNHLPSDKSLCHLEAFSQALHFFIPNDYLKECKI